MELARWDNTSVRLQRCERGNECSWASPQNHQRSRTSRNNCDSEQLSKPDHVAYNERLLLSNILAVKVIDTICKKKKKKWGRDLVHLVHCVLLGRIILFIFRKSINFGKQIFPSSLPQGYRLLQVDFLNQLEKTWPNGSPSQQLKEPLKFQEPIKPPLKFAHLSALFCVL